MSLLKEPMHPGEVLKELYLDPLDMGGDCFCTSSGRSPHADRAACEGCDQRDARHGSTPCPRIQYDPSILDEHADQL